MTTSHLPAGLVDAALTALSGSGLHLPAALDSTPAVRGLYGVFVDAPGLAELGLARHDATRPAYVGKSESSLLSRDIGTHFSTERTGHSTLRRSLGALLHEQLGLVPVHRPGRGHSSNYAFAADGDERLTRWMVEHVSLATWPSPSPSPLHDVEREVICRLDPPLNLTHVSVPWKHLKDRRAAMAAQVLQDLTKGPPSPPN